MALFSYFVPCPVTLAPTRQSPPIVQLFLSHSSAGDGFVRELRQALADLGQPVWIDSRQPLSSCQCFRGFSLAEQGQSPP